MEKENKHISLSIVRIERIVFRRRLHYGAQQCEKKPANRHE